MGGEEGGAVKPKASSSPESMGVALDQETKEGRQSFVTRAMNVCLLPASVYMLCRRMNVVVVVYRVMRTCHRPSTRRDARRRGGCRCSRVPRPTRDETRPSPTTRALGTAAAPSCSSIEAGKRQGQEEATGLSNSRQACERYEAVELRVAHMDSWPNCRLQLPLALLVMWPTTLTPSPHQRGLCCHGTMN